MNPILSNKKPDQPESAQPEPDTDSHGSDAEAIDESGGQKHRKRHKYRTPQEWKQQVIKNKQLSGNTYKNTKGQEGQARVMGPACTSAFCQK